MRLMLCIVAALIVGGCINLPPAVERELECPDPVVNGHFGNDSSCARPGSRSR